MRGQPRQVFRGPIDPRSGFRVEDSKGPRAVTVAATLPDSRRFAASRLKLRSGFYRRSQRSQKTLRVLSALVVNQIRAHSRPWLMSLRSVREQPPHLFYPRITRIFANMARVVSADGSFAAIRAIRGQPPLPDFVFLNQRSNSTAVFNRRLRRERR